MKDTQGNTFKCTQAKFISRITGGKIRVKPVYSVGHLGPVTVPLRNTSQYAVITDDGTVVNPYFHDYDVVEPENREPVSRVVIHNRQGQLLSTNLSNFNFSHKQFRNAGRGTGF